MSEPTPEFAPRLDSITTRWSLVRRAHAETQTTAGLQTSSCQARQALVLRYAGAIRSYIGAITRNDDQADEVAQEVVVRFMRGDFAGADPERGRFRDLMKTAVRNMVRNLWEREARRRGVDVELGQLPLARESGQNEEADCWTDAWRRNALDLAWSALEDHQRRHPDSVAYTLLRLRTDFPDETSEQLATRLSETTGRTIRADALRQQLRRARVLFAQLLVEELADGLDQPTPDRIQDELICLGLYEYIRDVLPSDWQPY
jgi:RNA polymerase sigma-70 factor (ECF subfamily)